MGLSHSRHFSSTSPPQSQPDYTEVVRSFNVSYAKLEEFVTDNVTLSALAKEVDLSSFWTAFEKRSDERHREILALETWRMLDNETKQERSCDHAWMREMEEIRNRLQAETDVLNLMHRRIQKREELFMYLGSWNEAQEATAREETSAIEVHPNTGRDLAPVEDRKALLTVAKASEDEIPPNNTATSTPIAEETRDSSGIPIRVREPRFLDGTPKSLLELYKEHRLMLLYEYHRIQCEIDKLEGKSKAKISRPLPKEPS